MKVKALKVGVLFLFLFTASAAVNRDPDSILRNHSSNFERFKMAADFINGLEGLTKQVAPELGLTGTLASFVSTLSNGGYTKQLETIMDVPVQKWNATAGWGRYDIVNVKRAVNQYQQVDAYNSMSSKIGTACKCLAAISILNDCIKGIQGDDQAKLSAIGNAAKWVQGDLISEYGGKSLNIAMAGVAIIDYALSSFIQFAFDSHQQFWFKGYEAYMEAKYSSPLEWAQFAEREGMEAVNRRLQEFWDNPEENASIYYLNGNSPPPNWGQVAGVLLEKYKKEFGATYFKESVYTTLKTYFTLRSEEAKANLELSFSRMAKDLSAMVKDMEMLKDIIENMPEDMSEEEGEEVTIKSLLDRLESIANQVSAFTGDLGRAQAQIGEFQPCLQTLGAARSTMTGLSTEIAAWQTSVDQQRSSDVDTTGLRTELMSLGDGVARSKDEAGRQSLKACEETLNLKWNFSNAEKQIRLPTIRSAANKARSEARNVERSMQTMKAKLGTVSDLENRYRELENQRRNLLAKVPGETACDGVCEKGQALLASMEANFQTMTLLEQNADGIVNQLHGILESQSDDPQAKFKSALLKMKKKATWLVYKKKVETLQGQIKAQVAVYASKMEELRAQTDKLQAQINELKPMIQDARQALGTPLVGAGSQSTYEELKSWVDAAELFVIPAKGAADQAQVCLQEAEALHENDTDDQGSTQGTSVAAGSGSSSTSQNTGSTTNPWDQSASNASSSWDRAAQGGNESSSTTTTNEGSNSGDVESQEADKWIQAAKNEANPPRCNFNLALQYLGRARLADPQHPELMSLETRMLKLQNDQMIATSHLAQAKSFLQNGLLDDALREARAAASKGSWCERNEADQLITQIENQKTRTTAIAERQREDQQRRDAAKSLISTLVNVQNTMINSQNPNNRSNTSNPSGGSSSGGTATGGSSGGSQSGGGPYCSITVSTESGGDTWVLFKQKTYNNVSNFLLFQWKQDPDDRNAMTPQQMAEQMSGSMGGNGAMVFLGQGSKTQMMNRLEQLCPNPVSKRTY